MRMQHSQFSGSRPTPADGNQLVKFRAALTMVVNTGTTAETARQVEPGEVIEIKANLAGDLAMYGRGEILPGAVGTRGRK